MDYLWLKALHVSAVLIWVGEVLAVATVANAFSGADQAQAPGRAAALSRARHRDRRIAMPAMVVAFGAGLALAMQGKWFPAPWLFAKVGFVGLFAALHGHLSGRLRRLERAAGPPAPGEPRRLSILAHLCIVAIAVLAVVKPF